MSLVFGSVGAVVIAAPAYAATYTVDSLTDDGSGFTLREAIVAANGNAGLDTITFAPGLVGGTILIDSVLTITEGLVIEGPGSLELAIERSAAVASFDILAFLPATADQDLTISGIRISGDGSETGSGLSVNVGPSNPRSVSLDDVFFSRLVTGAAGGAGVKVNVMTGVLSVSDSSFVDNQTDGSGAAISATSVGTGIFVTDSTFNLNVSDTDGGAVFINSPTAFVNISGSEFSINAAGFGAAGGAVMVLFATQVSVEDALFQDNTSYNAGGGLAVFGVTSLTVTDSHFERNTVTANSGGGLYLQSSVLPVTLDTVRFTLNTAINGAGFLVGEDNEILITDSTFRDNTASGDGGAIRQFGTFGTLTVERSTFDGNQAGDDGGAIYVEEVKTTAAVTIDSSVFFDNVAGDVGASLAIPSISGELTLINSTLDERALVDFAVFAATAPGGEFRILYSTIYGMVFLTSNEGTAEIVNSVLDGGGDPAVVVNSADPPVDVSYSILTSPLVPADVNDVAGNQFSVANTMLGPLQNNGGLTLTRLPLAGSPAIDNGLPGGTPPTFDQRFTGFPRVVGARVDVGAVEATPELAATGAELSGVIPLIGGALLLGGISAVLFGAVRRRAH